ncbi:hypothetical protein BGX24_005483 [Mortierella sp. AD032]|nr:hypothetical protein BGX24_005483 [Mortierella sp. AD032]
MTPFPLNPKQQQQQPLPQEFKDRIDALHSQSKSWYEHNRQVLDTLENHQRDLYEDHLTSLANINNNLQLTLSDTKILRGLIRILDERIDELRALIEKNRQMSSTQAEVIALLKEDQHALIASQTSLQERTSRLEADLAIMSLHLDAFRRRFVRIKKEIKSNNNKDSQQQCSNAKIAAEKERQDRINDAIQSILDSIRDTEAAQAESQGHPVFRHQEALSLDPTPPWIKRIVISNQGSSFPPYVNEEDAKPM